VFASIGFIRVTFLPRKKKRRKTIRVRNPKILLVEKKREKKSFTPH
jgi:hypothetical protein